MVYKIGIILLGLSILPHTAGDQTLAITTPSAHAIVQSYVSSFAASTSSAPTAYRLDFQMNGKYFDSCFLGGLTSCSVPFFPGWYGDGASTVQATAKDVFGNVVATSSLVPFLNRTIGLPYSVSLATYQMAFSYPASAATYSAMASFAAAGGSSIAVVNALGHDIGGATGTTLSGSYTVGNGANRLLVAAVVGNTGSNLLNGCTYNNVAMTQAAVQNGGGGQRWIYLFYMLNPPSGANTFACSSSSSSYLDAVLDDYTGVAQTGEPDATAVNVHSGTSLTTPITTIANNAWVMLAGGGYSGGSAPTAGAGSTRRGYDSANGNIGLYDSNGAVSNAPLPFTGNVPLGVQTGRTNPGNCTPAVDGVQVTSGTCSSISLNSTQFPNGPRELFIYSSNNSLGDPDIVSNTFSPSNVSGNNITITGHYLNTNRPVALSFTGTPPTCAGCTTGSLVAGQQWFGTSTPATNTYSATCASAVCTITTSNAHGLSAGANVSIDGAVFSSSRQYLIPLNGAWTVLSSPAPTSTTFAISVPGIADGTYATFNSQLITNAYFPAYVDNNTITLAQSPNGTPITFTGGGTGTHTISERMTTWYLPLTGYPGYGIPTQGFGYAAATFSNGSAAMELRPPYREIYLCVTPATGCPSTVNIAPYIENTDLSTTSISATSVAYNYTPDGGAQATILSVNSSGNVTALSPGWAQIAVVCSTCNAGASLPTVTIYARVYATTPGFPHFTHSGLVATTYTPGLSFWPNPMWHQSLLPTTPYTSSPQQTPWIITEMQESNINSTFEGSAPNVSEPYYNSCAEASSGQNTVDTYLQTAAVSAGTYFQYDITTVIQEFYTGVSGFGAFLNNSGWNRQACYQTWVSKIATNGRTFALEGPDEINHNGTAGLGPIRSGIMGQSSVDHGFNVDLAQIVSNGSGACTATVNQSFYGAWNQTTGNGDGITIINATTAGLNGFHLVRSSVPSGYNITQATSLTFDCTAASGTYNSSTDPNAQLVYFYTTLPRTCGLPSQIGLSLARNMPLGTVVIAGATNTNPSVYSVDPTNNWVNPVPTNGSTITVSGFTGSWAAENGSCVVVSANLPSESFHCSTVNGSSVNATGFGAMTGTPVFTTDLTSLVASGGTLTVQWNNHSLTNGQIIQIHSATNTNLHTIAPITYMNANTFTLPTLAANGTYNSSTDPNLFITVDCGFTNQTLSQVVSVTRAVNGPTINYAPIGSSIANTEIAYRWLGDPNALDAGMLYVAQGSAPIYGTGSSVSQQAASQAQSNLTDRAYILEPHRPLVSVGMTYNKICPGYVFQPACGDQPNNALIRPETFLTGLWAPIIWGSAGDFLYNYLNNPANAYSGFAVGSDNAGAFAISSEITPVVWTPMALTNALMKRLEPFYLQPRMNTPYFGPILPATAHQNSTNTARLLLIQCLSETPYPSQALNFTTLGFSYPGGTILKYVVDARKMVTSRVSGTSDSYSGCAASPGDVTAYIFLAAGASSPLDNVTFSAPATFPFGSSKMAIRVGYYPRYKGLLTMQDAPAINCTAGCIIPVDHSNADAWYQILYLDSNNLVKSAGDPQKIAKVN